MLNSYTFQNDDGSFNLEKLFERRPGLLEELQGKRIAVKIMQTRSSTVAQDTGFAGRDIQGALTVALGVRPVRSGEAVALVPEDGAAIYLHNLSIEFEDKAIKPDC
ncbi:MAG: hypothetical protein K0S02_1600 [Achromobacter mucicolens]|jgi:hypothetical protein|uniref:hypothetical protein n=1 Tax=Achromobacter mucicolens TaxID=1389922 RepID=UPI0024315FC2|nr:hypothetical protein [Achromobacter mucicolens]MDF2861328.1 hypothetical protein [Achromobacter mucicolens]